jgi:signal transduction histidine kinase
MRVEPHGEVFVTLQKPTLTEPAIQSPFTAWPIPANDLKPALQLALAIARADMGVLLLHDEAGGMLRPFIAHNMTETQCEQFGLHKLDAGAFGQATSEHRRVRVRDAWMQGDGLQDIARTIGFRHIEILPFFRRDGHVLGALGMIYRRKHGSPRRAAKLESFWADVMSVALSHAQARLEAERAQERTARTSDAKIQFLARMSHELRTPLQSISGYVDLLRAGAHEPLSPAQDRMLARIAESERILVHVVDDVITFARLEAGHVSYNLGPVLAEEALRVTEAVASPLAIDNDVRLEITPSVRGLAVIADGDKLKQILVNLLANAIKFTGPRGTVTVGCRADEEWVRFEVKDTGPGIARDKLRDIFEPYVQVGVPVVDRFGGSGLGLTISREFATGMSGELTATSDVGRGSTFSVRLPRYRGTVPVPPPESVKQTPRRRRVDRFPAV